jgi:hypothetical protein
MAPAEWILSRVMPVDRAAAVVGDLAEDAVARGPLWFWCSVVRVAVSHFLRTGLRFGEFSTGARSGLLIGMFWIVLIAGANVGAGGVSVWFASVVLLVMLMTGMTVGERTGSIRSALRVALYSGLLSGLICFIGLLAFTTVFSPSRAEPSKFLDRDALGGALNMLWISPMLTILFGAAGAVFGKALRRNDEKQKLV